MTGHFLLVLAFWNNFLYTYLTFTTLLIAPSRTFMPKLTQHFGAVLGTFIFLVVSIIRVAHANAHMATVQAVLTGLVAPTFGDLCKVL